MSQTLGIGLNSGRYTISEYKLTGIVTYPNKKWSKKQGRIQHVFTVGALYRKNFII
jgi:hypothetical protein